MSHPAVSDVTVEAILHALSEPVRVAIYAEIVGQDCPSNCSTFLRIGNRPIPKSTLSQHFKVLREAGLILSERRGVEMHNISRCSEIDARFPGLIATIVRAHEIQIADEEKKRKSSRRKAQTKSPRL